LNSVNLLLEQPGMGRVGRLLGTRELIIPGTPYIIPYRVKHHNVEILRVLHTAMEWPEVVERRASIIEFKGKIKIDPDYLCK